MDAEAWAHERSFLQISDAIHTVANHDLQQEIRTLRSRVRAAEDSLTQRQIDLQAYDTAAQAMNVPLPAIAALPTPDHSYLDNLKGIEQLDRDDLTNAVNILLPDAAGQPPILNGVPGPRQVIQTCIQRVFASSDSTKTYLLDTIKKEKDYNSEVTKQRRRAQVAVHVAAEMMRTMGDHNPAIDRLAVHITELDSILAFFVEEAAYLRAMHADALQYNPEVLDPEALNARGWINELRDQRVMLRDRLAVLGKNPSTGSPVVLPGHLNNPQAPGDPYGSDDGIDGHDDAPPTLTLGSPTVDHPTPSTGSPVPPDYYDHLDEV